VLRGKEELASTKRRVYLMEEAAAAKSCQTTDTQSGICTITSRTCLFCCFNCALIAHSTQQWYSDYVKLHCF